MSKKIQKNSAITGAEKQIKKMTGEKELQLPENYSVANALQAAWLELQQTKNKNKKPVLKSCNKTSIQQALIDMALQGLNPGKDQCYFVAYGKKLVCMPSYHGAAMVVKRLPEIFDIIARLIFEDDELTYEMDDGDIVDLNHKQKFGNRKNSKITGAYAVIKFEDERQNYVELLNMEQIKNAWKMGASNGNSPAHKNFPGEMSKKVAIGRAAKHYIKTSDDAGLMAEAYTRQENILTEESARQDIEDNANSEDFQEAVEEPEPEPEKKKTNKKKTEKKKSKKKKDDPEGKQEVTKNFEFLQAVAEIKKDMPPEEYENVKGRFGIEKSNQLIEKQDQVQFYRELKKLKKEFQE